VPCAPSNSFNAQEGDTVLALLSDGVVQPQQTLWDGDKWLETWRDIGFDTEDDLRKFK
jgi:hypothetical protein